MLPGSISTTLPGSVCKSSERQLSSRVQLLRTILALTDFSQKTIEKVVTRVFATNRTQHNTSFSLGSLQNTLSPQEETQFRQALQCTECSNSYHFVVESPHHPHCLICHSEVQCEYNMLSRIAIAPIRQIEPCNDRSR